jgi:peptidase A4-like protein
VPTAGDSTDGYSAAWVGLGGADSTSTALEQVGTESDYVNGQATYSAWYELLPDAPVTLNLDVSPGDQMHAAVTVDGSTVTITLSNLTTGKLTTKTLHMSDPDTTSAEWIAEAPSVETANGGYEVVPLADFATISFTDASATTADGDSGSISDSSWSDAQIDLLAANGGYRGVAAATTAEATTSSLTAGGTAFTVTRTSSTATQGGWGPAQGPPAI